VKELHFELWRQRRQQLLREALKGRLVRKFRASQRRVSSRPDGRPGRDADRIASKILAALRVPREKARCSAIRTVGRRTSG
jgi:hypothetical protein